MEDNYIVSLYLARDEQATRYTAATYGAYCRALVGSILTDAQDADACVADVWQKAWTAIPPQQPTSLKLFLASAARSVALGRHRALPQKKQNAEVHALYAELEGCIPDGAGHGETIAALDAYLATLPPEDRILWVRRYWYALPLSRLSAEAGVTEELLLARLQVLRDGLRTLPLGEETAFMSGERALDMVGEISKKYLREAEPAALGALVDLHVEKEDGTRRYKGPGLYTRKGYRPPPRKKPLRPAKRWMTVLAIIAVCVGTLVGSLVSLGVTLLGFAEPTDQPGVFILFGKEIDVLDMFGIDPEDLQKPNKTPAGNPIETKPPQPPVKHPCADGHDWVITEDRAATCYAVSRLTADCSRCDAERDELGEERLPHTFAGGTCSVCGLLEGAHDNVVAVPFELDGEIYARVETLVFDGQPAGETLVFPNVCFVEGYGLLPAAFGDSYIPFTVKTLIIPEGYLMLRDVLGVGNDDNQTLTTVSLPSTLREIGYGCFENCKALTAIALPEGLESIGKAAFKGCTSLSEITLPDSLTAIGDEAFMGCTALPISRLPASLSELGTSAFEGCASITVAEVPVGVGKILPRTFLGCASIPSMKLPEELTEVGDYAFAECSSLASVNLPERILDINKYTFYKCTSLAEVQLPSKLRSIENSAFGSCGFVSFHVPSSVNSIDDYAFSGCRQLTELTFEGSLTSLGSNLLRGCTSLRSVTLPEGTEKLPNNMFYECTSLETVSMPNSVLSIGDGVFFGCASLRSVKLSSKLNRVPNNLFDGCPDLSELTMDEGGISYYVSGGCLIEVRSASVRYATCNAAIPADGSVTAIADGAFRGRNVTSVTIPEGVSEVGSWAFMDCKLLYEISLPASMRTLGASAFENCVALEEMIIPEGTVKLESGLFERCYKLRSVHLPSTMTTPGDMIFDNCTSLEEVHLQGNIAKWRALIKWMTPAGANVSFTVYCNDGYIRPDGAASPYPEDTTETEPETDTEINIEIETAPSPEV